MRPLITLALVLSACSSGAAVTTTTDPATIAPTSNTAPPPTTTTSTTTPTVPPTTTTTAPTTTLPPLDPAGASILDLHQAMAEGRLTAVALMEYTLGRIEMLEPDINAYITVDPDAMDLAEALDREREAQGMRGPLHGIPVVVKDNFNTADMPTTAGSIALDAFVPFDDADQVAALRQAGAIIVGKANLYEFARTTRTNSSLGGQTWYPWNSRLNVGGSSGGTAAAVTTEMAMAGLGTDTCGSIRIPSAFNGLYGLRPTIGLSSTAGIVPLAPFEDTGGPMTRYASDLAIVLDATSGDGSYLSAAVSGTLEGRRIGVLEDLSSVQGSVDGAFRDALALMEEHGATVISVTVPNRSRLVGDATSIFLREFRFALQDYLAQYPHAPVGSLREIVDRGLYLPEIGSQLATDASRPAGTLESAAFRNAMAQREPLREAITAVMDENDLDALAYPPVRNTPAPVGRHQPGNNCPTGSVSGLPSLVIPVGLADGSPTGLELLGRAFDEATLIGIAAGWDEVFDRPLPP